MSTFRLPGFSSAFLNVFLEYCYGKKDPCAVFGCNNDHLFPEKYAVKDHISNTKLQRRCSLLHPTRHKDLFSHYNLILRKR